MNVEIDDGLYENLEELAKSTHRSVQHLLNQLVDEYQKRQGNLPGTIAPKGYGLRPEEKKRT